MADYPIDLDDVNAMDADAFIAATASQVGGTLVHKDPEMEQVSGIISTEKLPYKTSTR